MGRKIYPRSLAVPARYKDAHTIQRRDGYILEYCPLHPACNARGMVLQHRLIFECYLHRFLSGQEVVHHNSDDKTDNHLGNLALFENQTAHMRHHQRLKAKRYDPVTIELVRKAAANPNVTVGSLPLSATTVNIICKLHGIDWMNAGRVHLSDKYVRGILHLHTRSEAVRILGVSLQTLWYLYPG